MHLPPRTPCQPGGSVGSQSAYEVLPCLWCSSLGQLSPCTVLETKGKGQMELGGHGPIRQAADGATASDRDGITLLGSMTQPLATAPLDTAQILLRSKHQCIFFPISTME